jgi:ketosteroid isomerase-like protein
MSQNADRLYAGYERFNLTREYDMDLLAPAFELHDGSGIIDTAGRVFQGRASLIDVLRGLEEAFEELRWEIERLVEVPDGRVLVFVRVRGRGRGSGVETDARIAHVWTFRDDKAVRMHVFEERAEALEAVGLSEQDAHADS